MTHFIDLGMHLTAIIDYWHKSTFDQEAEDKYYELEKKRDESDKDKAAFTVYANTLYPVTAHIYNIQIIDRTDAKPAKNNPSYIGTVLTGGQYNILTSGIEALRKSVSELTETIEAGIIDKHS